MGLLDILNGMKNGPRGPSGPDSGSNTGGMSPMTMAILAMLAYKAMKHFGGNEQAPAQGRLPDGTRTIDANTTTQAGAGGGLGGLGDLLTNVLGGGQSGGTAGGGAGGGLSDLLKGGLGGILAGGAAGSIINGGLGELIEKLKTSGQSEAADSWVSSGPNKQINSNDLASALGADQINQLTSQTGYSRDELLDQLSRYLPEVINDVTPDGQLPKGQDTSRWL